MTDVVREKHKAQMFGVRYGTHGVLFGTLKKEENVEPRKLRVIESVPLVIEPLMQLDIEQLMVLVEYVGEIGQEPGEVIPMLQGESETCPGCERPVIPWLGQCGSCQAAEGFQVPIICAHDKRRLKWWALFPRTEAPEQLVVCGREACLECGIILQESRSSIRRDS